MFQVTLLNSIHDNFENAMSSAAGREQFLKQLDQIVEGVKQNRTKVFTLNQFFSRFCHQQYP